MFMAVLIAISLCTLVLRQLVSVLVCIAQNWRGREEGAALIARISRYCLRGSSRQLSPPVRHQGHFSSISPRPDDLSIPEQFCYLRENSRPPLRPRPRLGLRQDEDEDQRYTFTTKVSSYLVFRKRKGVSDTEKKMSHARTCVICLSFSFSPDGLLGEKIK